MILAGSHALNGGASPLMTFVARCVLVFVLAACGNDSTSSPTISAIEISPSPCAIGRGSSLQMSARATSADGTKQILGSSAGVSWSTANKDTATVNPSGILVGVSVGITAITASYQGATGTLDCTVTP
jgi:hypothetical protein